MRPTPPSRVPFNAASMQLARRSLALLAALCLAAGAKADTRVYTSQASFLAALGAASTETFNRFTQDISGASSHPAGGDFGGDFVLQGSWMIDAPQNLRDIDGSTNLFFGMSPASWADLSFNAPLRAFGAWFAGAPATIRIDAANLEGPGSYRHVVTLTPATTGLQFIGFTSDQTFNRIVFESALCCSSSFAIDDVAYAASLSPVPEPENWALMAVGLAGLAGWARRRIARAPSA